MKSFCLFCVCLGARFNGKMSSTRQKKYGLGWGLGKLQSDTIPVFVRRLSQLNSHLSFLTIKSSFRRMTSFETPSSWRLSLRCRSIKNFATTKEHFSENKFYLDPLKTSFHDNSIYTGEYLSVRKNGLVQTTKSSLNLSLCNTLCGCYIVIHWSRKYNVAATL